MSIAAAKAAEGRRMVAGHMYGSGRACSDEYGMCCSTEGLVAYGAVGVLRVDMDGYGWRHDEGVAYAYDDGSVLVRGRDDDEGGDRFVVARGDARRAILYDMRCAGAIPAGRL